MSIDHSSYLLAFRFQRHLRCRPFSLRTSRYWPGSGWVLGQCENPQLLVWLVPQSDEVANFKSMKITPTNRNYWGVSSGFILLCFIRFHPAVFCVAGVPTSSGSHFSHPSSSGWGTAGRIAWCRAWPIYRCYLLKMVMFHSYVEIARE